MWKYIVTYILVIQTPEIKNGSWTRIDAQFTDFQTREFDTKKEAEIFKKAAARIKYKDIFLKEVTLDSIFIEPQKCLHLEHSVTMVYCDPPIIGCNTATCYKCGKTWPTY